MSGLDWAFLAAVTVGVFVIGAYAAIEYYGGHSVSSVVGFSRECQFDELKDFTGYSMFPVLRPGDRVGVSRTVQPLLGDVVTFVDEDTGVIGAHRIVYEQSNGFLTKGDNNAVPDTFVRRDAVTGVVCGVVQ